MGRLRGPTIREEPSRNRTIAEITAAYMGTSDELVAKLRGGSASNYDVISPSSDVVTSIAAAGLAAPLDLSKLPSYPQLSDRLRNAPLVRINGNVYGVPFVWGAESPAVRHHVFQDSAGQLVRAMGFQFERKDFRLGRFINHMYGCAGPWL
jgi:spermidine/putrescine-binding protein